MSSFKLSVSSACTKILSLIFEPPLKKRGDEPLMEIRSMHDNLPIGQSIVEEEFPREQFPQDRSILTGDSCALVSSDSLCLGRGLPFPEGPEIKDE